MCFGILAPSGARYKTRLESGIRQAYPDYMYNWGFRPKYLCDLMSTCWHFDPEKRLTFRQITQRLSNAKHSGETTMLVGKKKAGATAVVINSCWEQTDSFGANPDQPHKPGASAASGRDTQDMHGYEREQPQQR